ncbi:hypothetical protein QBC46DRAFT_40166 [Diplogelasinospora grovesii]|uniref:Uncharacterized protein n=1 Tax=Diplogelasinospora grovesii TaxID=303347 RepID=A0AAN6S7K5_9PEZI|nr:hypothetical protein QBC46DRAFT_40166 [Diplogelasinospora grovesii]
MPLKFLRRPSMFTMRFRRPTYATGYNFDSMTKRRADASLGDTKRFEDNELPLVAQMPLIRLPTKRLMNPLVCKECYWNAKDRKSWHVHYSEMTQLSLDAFRLAAQARGEVFALDQTPLWLLATKYFPPTLYVQERGSLDDETNETPAVQGSPSIPAGSIQRPAGEVTSKVPRGQTQHESLIAERDWKRRCGHTDRELQQSLVFRDMQIAARGMAAAVARPILTVRSSKASSPGSNTTEQVRADG